MLNKPDDRLYLKNLFQEYGLNSLNHFMMVKALKMMLFLMLILMICGIISQANADIWDELKSHDDKVHEYDEDLYEFEDYIWKEGKTGLPDYPVDKNLLAIQGPSEYQNYQYLIDVKNLRADPDGVVRYTIVISAPSGSQNVMFEGLRCSSGEYKTYAYGNANRFIKKKTISWRRVNSRNVMGYTRSLADNYFCNNLGEVLKRHEIVQNIKYGKGTVDGIYIE